MSRKSRRQQSAAAMPQSAIDKSARAVDKIANLAAARVDGWENSVRGVGSSADPATQSRLRAQAPIDWARAQNFYLYDDIMHRIADVPAQEMMRRGWDLSVPTSRLLAKPDELARKTVSTLEDLDVSSAITEALTWTAVYGGAAILPVVDDRHDKERTRPLDKPMAWDSIRGICGINVLTAADLRVSQWQEDMSKPRYGEPLMYEVWHQRGIGGLTTGTKIHATRVWRFDAGICPYDELIRRNGWAPSRYEAIVDVVRDYAMTYSSLGAIVQNASQAVMKFGNLAATLMEDGGEDVVRQRIRLMDLTRSVLKSVVLDASEQESFEYHSATMTGYKEAVESMSARLAAAASMPQSLLFGQAPSGLSATGAADLRFFYDHIDGRRQKEVKPFLEWIVRMVLASARGPTGGEVPSDWEISFPPLWQATEDEAAQIYSATATADASYIMQGAASAKEVFEARWRGGRFHASTLALPEPVIEAAATETSATAEGAPGADRQRQALNGAQVISVVDIVTKTALGQIPRSSAVQILLAALPIEKTQAEAIIGDAGGSFTISPRADANDADSWVPPNGAQESAERGLALREEFGRGGTPTGIARARDISNGKALPMTTIKRMKAFFDRHEQNKDTPPEEGNGKIAWLLWGGDAARTWAEGVIKREGDS